MDAKDIGGRLQNIGSGQRISNRLIVLIIAFSSLITLVVSVIQLIQDYRQQRQDLNATLEQIAIYEPTIAAGVWNFDRQQIVLALETLNRLPNDVERATVTTDRHDQSWSAGKITSRHVVTKVFPLRHGTGANDEAIGELEVVASLDAIYKSVAVHAVSILLSNGLKTFLVAVFMYFLFRRLVTDRLERLARTVAELEPLITAPEKSLSHAPLPNNGDELDILQQAFNDMGQKLKQSIDELRNNQLLLQSILDNSTALIFVKDLEGRFLLINRRFEELFHVKREDLIGRTAYDLFPASFAAALHATDQSVIQSGKVIEAEQTVPHDDGLHTYISIKAPLFDETGKAYAMCAVATDITERKRTEEELKRHRYHLEDMVAERNAELVIAKERADVANQAKSTFLTNMSHELRTPLNAILGYAQILAKDKQLSERQRAGLNTIQQSGAHLLNLITDLLDLSRIEAGKFDLNESAIKLPTFLYVIGDLIRIKAEQKNLIFQLELAANLPTVRADEKRLRQVLLNLLGNAVKFTDHGSVSLRVQELARDGDKVTLHFEVQDIGIGMNTDQLEAIFKPFEQVGEVERRYGGSGLGLSISRQLVRLMGSDIQVHSQPGEGSRFWFDLTVPLADDRAMQAAPKPAVYCDAPEVPLLAPPDSELKVLHGLALQGNMRDIMHWADQLEMLNEQYRPFSNKLRRLSKEYQSKAILALVERHMETSK